jgi:hypothetical protein
MELVGKPDERDHLEDLDVDRTVNFYQTTRNHILVDQDDPLYEPKYVTWCAANLTEVKHLLSTSEFPTDE